MLLALCMRFTASVQEVSRRPQAYLTKNKGPTGILVGPGSNNEGKVEAGGIEPPSESGLPKASTMLSSRFVLDSSTPMSGIL